MITEPQLKAESRAALSTSPHGTGSTSHYGAGLTVEQAAKILGYKEMTVYAKIQRKQIVPRKIGRDVRIYREDNEELFALRAQLASA